MLVNKHTLEFLIYLREKGHIERSVIAEIADKITNDQGNGIIDFQDDIASGISTVLSLFEDLAVLDYNEKEILKEAQRIISEIDNLTAEKLKWSDKNQLPLKK